MNGEILRLVDSIHRDKSIDRELLFESLESALASAARKSYGLNLDVEVSIDRETGAVKAVMDGEEISPEEFGRIAANTAKQVLIQKIKEAEGNVIYDDFSDKIGTIVSGSIFRFNKKDLIVNLGKCEGILPYREQVFNEKYRIGERIRAYVLDVEKKGQRVDIVLSRSHENFVRELFKLEVPEISEKVIEIKNIVREAGQRTKIALLSSDSKVDCVGACVGIRGSRIKSIINELNGEKIDIVKWNPAVEMYIVNALSPTKVSRIELEKDRKRARIIVPDDQLPLVIGKKGQNIRLSAKITDYHLDVITETDLKEETENRKNQLMEIPELNDSMVESLIISGINSIEDVLEQGVDGLKEFKGIGDVKAASIIQHAEEIFKKTGVSEAAPRAQSEPKNSQKEAK